MHDYNYHNARSSWKSIVFLQTFSKSLKTFNFITQISQVSRFLVKSSESLKEVCFSQNRPSQSSHLLFQILFVQSSLRTFTVFHIEIMRVSMSACRAANNSRPSDNGWPKFANVRQNRNLGRTFCPANFLLHHLTISFINKIWPSYMLLFGMCLCVYVGLNFPLVRPKWCPSWTYVLSTWR